MTATDPLTTTGPLTATGHPLQRAGAWAAAVMAERHHPRDVTAVDAERVAATMVQDVLTAATAVKDTAPYGWWKVLYALYPNSKATRSSRPRDRALLQGEIEALFVADTAEARVGPCAFCSRSASVLWAKSNLPLFDSSSVVNMLPLQMRGWPVCYGCRIAMWALPYGAWVSAGSATVLSCESEAAIEQFARRNVQRARRITQAGFTGLPADARPEYVTLVALRDAAPGLCATTLWTFKNNNENPWLRVTQTRRAVPVFLARVDANAALRRGWHLLARSLTRYDKAGKATASGVQEAARLLFEAEDGRSQSLLLRVHELLKDTDRVLPAGGREGLARLALAYAEEVLGMTSDVTAVATLIAQWIARGTSPRGRFAEYRSAALSDYKLGILLMQAYSRLLLDGQAPILAGPEQWQALIQRRPRAWEQRMLLFAQVSVLLQQQGVAISDQPAGEEEQRRLEALENQPILDDEEFDYEMGPA
ncbi:CRISPR-associated protein Cst1 [Streptomyces aurantiacus]|uniref:hypothetical protein n=1 Tax=Streptomyces aurantiacus TaxID=47760 RepID=UPI002792F7F4|nr:hypothetical protein [Streptomyces aurantiacus]MDQ0773046.1 CRISPR-associated protein Cst1 [Streptomyces aurantiacus]